METSASISDGHRADDGFVAGAQAVVHQPERDRVGTVDDDVPERKRGVLPGDRFGLRSEFVQRGRQRAGDGRTAAFGSELRDERTQVQSRLHQAAGGRKIDGAARHQQLRQQLHPSGTAEVAHGRGVALPDVDQAGVAEPLERLAHGRAGYAEHLGQPALARQRFADQDVATDHLGGDLVEDVIGHRATRNRFQWHPRTVMRAG